MDFFIMNLVELQYRGDRLDIESLIRDYQVGDYLKAHAENRRTHQDSMRDQLLSQGIQLNSDITPRAFCLVGEVFERLSIEAEVEIFCIQDAGINAFAFLEGDSQIIGITSAALEILTDAEIRFIIGHELGHFIFQHNTLMGLINSDKDTPRVTVLPYLGERLFLNWRKKSELSADRIGYLAAGDFKCSGSALLKTGFGLSEKNLNLDLESLMRQIDIIRDSAALARASFGSHPLLPLRLQALKLFSDAYEAKGFEGIESCEDAIDAVMSVFRRYPSKPIHVAVMQAIACAGTEIIASENSVLDEEIRTLVTTLHEYFTDDPEKEILLDAKERGGVLDEAIRKIIAEEEEGHKVFVLSRLADVAIADGKLLEEEAGGILQLAERMGVTSRSAYSILFAAAQANGFKVDVQMNKMVARIRHALLN